MTNFIEEARKEEEEKKRQAEVEKLEQQKSLEFCEKNRAFIDKADAVFTTTELLKGLEYIKKNTPTADNPNCRMDKSFTRSDGEFTFSRGAYNDKNLIGKVEYYLVWTDNYSRQEIGEKVKTHYIEKHFTVAYTLDGNLEFHSSISQILSEDMWSKNPDLIERALESAYKNATQQIFDQTCPKFDPGNLFDGHGT